MRPTKRVVNISSLPPKALAKTRENILSIIRCLKWRMDGILFAMAEAANGTAWPRNGGDTTPGSEPDKVAGLLKQMVGRTDLFRDRYSRFYYARTDGSQEVTDVWTAGNMLDENGGAKEHFWGFHYRVGRGRFCRQPRCVVSITHEPRWRLRIFEAHLRMQGVEHPNLTPVWHTFLRQQSAVVIQPYVPYCLAEVDFSRKEMLTFMAQAAAGLAHLHGCRLIHRDIAPHNVLINEDRVAMLCDWDSVKEIPEGEQSMPWEIVICRTELAPPEALGRGDVGYAGDVWTFAVMVYCMLMKSEGAGEDYWLPEFVNSAHREEISPDEMARRLREEPRLVRWPGDTPSRLQDLVDRSVMPAMEERPTAAEVQEELARIAQTKG
jgi:Protein kinase domain